MLINIPDADMPAIARLLAQLPGAVAASGLPASAAATASVSDQCQRRATKSEQFRRDCHITLTKQLGQGFAQYVNLSSIKG